MVSEVPSTLSPEDIPRKDIKTESPMVLKELPYIQHIYSVPTLS